MALMREPLVCLGASPPASETRIIDVARLNRALAHMIEFLTAFTNQRTKARNELILGTEDRAHVTDVFVVDIDAAFRRNKFCNAPLFFRLGTRSAWFLFANVNGLYGSFGGSLGRLGWS